MWHTVKANSIQARYYLRQAAKRLSALLPILLFLASFMLFSTVFFPKVVQRLSSSLAAQPERMTLTGHVIFQSDGDSAPACARGARIRIGGFATTTDDLGAYYLDFWTSTRNEIPVVIRYREITAVKNLDLPVTGDKWTRSWSLQEE